MVDYVFGICFEVVPVIVLITIIDVFAKCRTYMVEHHSLHSFAIKKKIFLYRANTQNALQWKYRTLKKSTRY